MVCSRAVKDMRWQCHVYAGSPQRDGLVGQSLVCMRSHPVPQAADCLARRILSIWGDRTYRATLAVDHISNWKMPLSPNELLGQNTGILELSDGAKFCA